MDTAEFIKLTKERKHGVTAYRHRGCRCSECRSAVADYRRRHRAGLTQPIDEDRIEEAMRLLDGKA